MISPGQRRQNDFRQMCILWMRENRPDVVKLFYAELDKRYPVKRPRIKLPKSVKKERSHAESD